MNLQALTIAEWFVNRANKEFVDDETPEGITNLKLQKLLYFAQAVHISIHDEPLFQDKIEAWTFGPVVPSVYHKLKEFKNGLVNIVTPSGEVIEPEVLAILEDVWSVYGKYSAHELVNITHAHRPWKDVFKKAGGNEEITIESMRDFYSNYYIVS